MMIQKLASVLIFYFLMGHTTENFKARLGNMNDNEIRLEMSLDKPETQYETQTEIEVEEIKLDMDLETKIATETDTNQNEMTQQNLFMEKLQISPGIYIFEYLAPIDLRICCKVCRNFSNILQSKKFWQVYAKYDFRAMEKYFEKNYVSCQLTPNFRKAEMFIKLALKPSERWLSVNSEGKLCEDLKFEPFEQKEFFFPFTLLISQGKNILDAIFIPSQTKQIFGQNILEPIFPSWNKHFFKDMKKPSFEKICKFRDLFSYKYIYDRLYSNEHVTLNVSYKLISNFMIENIEEKIEKSIEKFDEKKKSALKLRRMSMVGLSLILTAAWSASLYAIIASPKTNSLAGMYVLMTLLAGFFIVFVRLCGKEINYERFVQ